MSETNTRRTGRFGAIFVGVVVAGSAVGVLGWHLMANRDDGSMDSAGFDLAQTPDPGKSLAAPAPVARPAQAAPPSSLGSIQVDEDMKASNRIVAAPKPAPVPATAVKKRQNREDFAKAAGKQERSARAIAERMEEPELDRFAKDWMRAPDLKKLSDAYGKDKDPVQFLLGAARSESLGRLLKKYAGSADLRRFVLQSAKQSTPEFRAAAEAVLNDEPLIKDLFANSAKSLGLPPTIAGIVERSGPPKVHLSKPGPANEQAPAPSGDQSKVLADMMNNPELQKAMQGQGQQAPPVNLGR